ncbi:MAG TPA: hypothetical protein PKO06_02435, partial [Candidatus Ozemobacteraceae bacterium]|nr:hypothetical protein [Candidatus Ozemobacteraceae bacterium]
MGEIILFLVIGILITPVLIIIHIYRRLSDLRSRIEENFANDQAEKHVIRRALDRLRQLEETVQQLSAARGAGTTPTLVEPTPSCSITANETAAEKIVTDTAMVSDQRPSSVQGSLPPEPGERVRATATASAGAPGTGEPSERVAHESFLPPIPTETKAVPRAVPASGQPLPETPRTSVRQPEWEAVIGGNLLNKLGAFILVIGLGLFLYYTLDSFGPAAKLLIG